MSVGSRGTATFISRIAYEKHVQWGGFDAYLVLPRNQDFLPDDLGTIFLAGAIGPIERPSLVLLPTDQGYSDWKSLFDKASSNPGRLKFVGSADAEENVIDQWCTHGPSPLLPYGGTLVTSQGR